MKKKVISGICWLLYFLTVLSFFRENFVKWRLSFLPGWGWFALPLAGLLLYRALPFFKNLKEKGRSLLIFLCLFGAVLLPRLPFLLNPYVYHSFDAYRDSYHPATIDSDSAILLLMGKHIGEGRHRPVYFYSVNYHGALTPLLYGVAFRVFGFEAAVPFVLNLLSFALLILLLALLVEKVSGRASLLTFAILALPLSSSLFLSLEYIQNYALTYLLALSSFYLAFAGERESSVAASGFLAGLSFWKYQGILPLAGLAGLFVLGRRKFSGFMRWAAAFAAGCFPHLLAELHSGFANTKMILLEGRQAAGGVKEVLLSLVYPVRMLDASSLTVKYISLFVFLPALGFLLYRGIKDRKALVLPLLYIFLSLSFALGKSAVLVRFRIHYIPLALLALAIVAASFLYLPRKIALLLIAGLWLWKGVYIAKLVPAVENLQRLTVKEMAALRKAPERVFAGTYWDTFLFNPLLEEEKLFVPLPVAYHNRAIFHLIRYYPYALQFGRAGDEGEPLAFLFRRGLYSRMKALVKKLDARCSFDFISTRRFIMRCSKPWEMVQLLSQAVHQGKWQAEVLLPVEAEAERDKVCVKAGLREGRVRQYRVRMKREGEVLEFPLPASGMKTCWRLPWSEEGLFKGLLLLRGYPFKEFSVKLEGREKAPHLSVGSDPLRFFYPFRLGFRPGRGLALPRRFCLYNLPPESSFVQLQIINPFNFDEDVWLRRLHQELRWKGGRRLLAEGVNSVVVPVEGRERICFSFRYTSYFRAVDLSGNVLLVRAGGFLEKAFIYLKEGRREQMPLFLLFEP